MEIVDYIGADGFTHHIITNSMGIPFFLYWLLFCTSALFIYLVLKKFVW